MKRELEGIKPTSENEKPLKITEGGKKALEELGFKVDKNKTIKAKVLEGKESYVDSWQLRDFPNAHPSHRIKVYEEKDVLEAIQEKDAEFNKENEKFEGKRN